MPRYMTLRGEPIRISARQDLRCSRGRIVKARGTPVHAATFIRRRLIVLDARLLASTTELRRILLHELFHFVWPRLANPVRRSFALLLLNQQNASGELGWSSEYRKQRLASHDIRGRSPEGREYCCEAFWDTAAFG